MSRPRRSRAEPAFPADIIAALDDPALFGPLFGSASWAAWRVFLAALFGLPMSEAEAAAFRHHTGRTALPAEPFREAALVCGRRGGKSRVLGLVAVFLAVFRDYTDLVAPGETPVVAIIARDRDQARVILGYVRGLMRAVPILAGMIADDLAESVRLTSGVVIGIHSGTIGAPRGRTFAAVLCDEIAFWRSRGFRENPDTEIIRAVRPGLATIPGAMLLMASSPYARRGVLFDTFQRHFGRDDSRILVWRGTTLEMNPALDPTFIAEARAEDPEGAAAEYDAQFREDVGPFVPREVVEACVTGGVREQPPMPGMAYAAFCDPSGGSSDAMTLAIAHTEAAGPAVLDVVREVRAPFRPEEVVEEFARLLREYGISRVTGDRFGGAWPVEAFARHGIAYEASTASKSDLYREFLPLLTGRRVQLLDHPRLLAQLCGLERRTARGGKDSIDHPSGAHDDLANAAAGALVAVAAEAKPTLIRARDLMAPDGAPVPMPTYTDVLSAVLIVSTSGMAAVSYWATYTGQAPTIPPLALLDFTVDGFSGELIDRTAARLEELHREIGRVAYGRLLWVPRALVQAVHLRGFQCEDIPPELMRDPQALALAAAAHVTSGQVRMTAASAEKARASPLAGALSFQAGERVDADPLRFSVIAAIVLALTPADAMSVPVLPVARLTAA